MPDPQGFTRTISPSIWPELAQQLGVKESVLRAVAEVESKGEGFLPAPSIMPKILFEAHLFHAFTTPKGRFDVSHPTLSSPTWNRALYKGGHAEWGRLEVAKRLDETAAYRATSWGAFQIIGNNYGACGFTTVQSFVAAHMKGADEQARAFGHFCASYARGSLLLALKAGNAQEIARLYNGESYAANKYDTKILAAMAKFAAA